MAIQGLEHVNIATEDVARTAGFYAEVLGLRAMTPRLGAKPEDVQWLYDPQDRAIIHVARPEFIATTGLSAEAKEGSGAIHHVAFACDDYDTMLAALESAGRVERKTFIESMGLRQIFTRDPNGILVELNFFGD